MLKKKVKNQKGFTLVELLVVIAIIGILAAVIAPNAFKAVEKGKIAAAEADYKAIKSAALNYYTDVGTWPATANTNSLATTTFVGPNTATTGWNGPYLERWPSKNPWGGTYAFNNDNSVSWDSDTTGDTARYVTMTLVPDSAHDRLVADLGSDVVRQNSTTITTIYILVSRD
ncbi:MAG: type II secretion system protein [Bacillota bacterium]